MEIKNTQRSVSETNVFKIPINIYEEDMEKETSRQKKEEILNLFQNHNQLRSEEEFNAIKDMLHYACQEGDIESIKILLSETIKNDSKVLSFKIDKTNKTASLFQANQELDTLIVPRTVEYDLNDYLVTSIFSIGCNYGLKSRIKRVKFEENSAVRTIYGYSFARSNIEIYK